MRAAHFASPIVRPDQYILHAGAASGSIVSQPLDLGPGKGRDGIELVLPRGGEVAGRIHAPHGASCAGLRIWIGSKASLMSVRETVKDLGADGRFDIGGLPPGTESVYLLLPVQKQRISHGSVSMSGGLTNEVELGTVEVIDDGRTERDFEVPEFPGTLVIDLQVNGEIVAGVSLDLTMQKGEQSFSLLGETDARGRFGPALAFPGSWTLRVRDADADWCYTHPSPLLVSPARESAAAIQIQVSTATLAFLDAASGAPLASRFVSVLGPKADAHFEFPMQRRMTDAGGRASFSLASGEYRLRLDEGEELPFFGEDSDAEDERIAPIVWTLEGPLTHEIRL